MFITGVRRELKICVSTTISFTHWNLIRWLSCWINLKVTAIWKARGNHFEPCTTIGHITIFKKRPEFTHYNFMFSLNFIAIWVNVCSHHNIHLISCVPMVSYAIKPHPTYHPMHLHITLLCHLNSRRVS